MGSLAFKNGKPLFKNGKPVFTGSPCTCTCGCACGDVAAVLTCSTCITGCVPRVIEAVVSGVTPLCTNNGSDSIKADSAGLNATFSLVIFSTCAWQHLENPGTTVNFKAYFGTVCGGAFASQHLAWQIDAIISGGTLTARIFASVPGFTQAQLTVFTGAVSVSDCATTLVVSNSGGAAGTGGTITLTFCP